MVDEHASLAVADVSLGCGHVCGVCGRVDVLTAANVLSESQAY